MAGLAAAVKASTYRRAAALAAGALALAAGAVSPTAAVEQGAALVVASDRHVDGSRELLLLGADGRELRRLTRHTPQGASPAWSPDGRRIAFVGALKDDSDELTTRGVWTSKPDGTGARRLFAKRDTWWPTWSPDGRALLFIVDDTLWTVDADGSNARRLSPPSLSVVDAEWSPDGRKIAVSECRDERIGCGVSVADRTGRGWRRITRRPSQAEIEDEIDVVWEVRWSPDARAVSFMRGFLFYGPTPAVEVAGVGSRFDRRIAGGDSPRWSPDGRRIAFVRVKGDSAPNGIAIVGRDGRGLRVLADVPGSEFAPAWSKDGRKIVFATTVSGTTRFYEVTPATRALRPLTRARATLLRGVVGDDQWAPDGRRFVLMQTREAPPDIDVGGPDLEHLIDVVTIGGGRVTLTRPAEDTDPSWSPNGAHIAFARREGMRSQIMVVAAAGGPARALTDGTRPRWAPAGSNIVFERGGSIVLIAADGTGERSIAAGASAPAWAPDGRSVAFVRTNEIWTTPISNAAAPVQLSAARECRGRAWSPAWSPDGGSVAYIVSCVSGDSTLIAADSDGSDQRALVAELAFAGELDGHAEAPVWSPDGAMLAYADLSDRVYAVARDGSRRVLLGKGSSPAWSPDGSRLAVVVDRFWFGARDVWTMNRDGSDQRRLTTRGSNIDPAWRP